MGAASRLEKSRPPEAGADAAALVALPSRLEKSRPPLLCVVEATGAGAGAVLGWRFKKAKRSPFATPACDSVLEGGDRMLPYFVTTMFPSKSKRAFARSKTSWIVNVLGTGMLSDRPVFGSWRVMVMSLIFE